MESTQPDNKKIETIETYNRSAKSLADKFDGLGARTSDIEETFNLTQKTNPNVLEIGCGNGRDASEILKRTDRYLGVDVSSELIKLAKEKNPTGSFLIADINSFTFPFNLDIIFAFASLIHLSKEDFSAVIDKSWMSLNSSGVFRISLKYSEMYEEVTKEDEFGLRTYYRYSREDILGLVKDFSIKKCELNDLRGQKWLEILLQK